MTSAEVRESPSLEKKRSVYQVTDMKYQLSQIEAMVTNYTHQSLTVMKSRKAKNVILMEVTSRRRKGVASHVNQFYLYKREVGHSSNALNWLLKTCSNPMYS